ncbi:hypothetical protein VNI00_005588 [Paramarasmius palmivorus]|uniref:CxC1-like cysteine cluster associated with KDZ transposases domain-containing protein n=1 Tax=Paramarasmius palmivorus TaxID=297713 RepID=A0AAW0DEM4_9AGAR
MGRNKKRYGSSRSVSFIYGDPVKRNGKPVLQEQVQLTQRKEAWEADRDKAAALFSAMSYPARDTVGDPGPAGDYDSDNDSHNITGDTTDSQAIDMSNLPPPPGQEGLINSHAGGEYDMYTLTSTLTSKTRRSDDRTRADRIQKQVESWASQLPMIIKSYLAHKARGTPTNGSIEETFTMPVIDLNESRTRTFFHPAGSSGVNDSLAQHGYLGATPDRPQIAFPFHMFHVFRQIRRVCPKFNIDALSKALQHIHGLPRDEHLENQLRGAYDTYLAIQRQLKTRTLQSLSRDDFKSFTSHICPPCTYELQGEVPLQPRMLISIDGNNSAKLVASEVRSGQERIDTRHLPSFRWLEPEEVDRFANEVKAGRTHTSATDAMDVDQGVNRPTDNSGPDSSDEVAWLNKNETEELASCDDTCVERWKAAGPESQKKMFSLFAISGVFIAVCRHGHILSLCDMIRSGELMKYPLATVNALIDGYGDNLGIGYDIWCAFTKTIKRSPLLGRKFMESKMTGVVPAFHGYAHNRPCQTGYHPKYREGVGIEDFEGCERINSLSNQYASTTRLTTRFHRRQTYQEFMDFNDEDKFASSADFIYQNYRQAVEHLARNQHVFEELCETLKISPADCESFLEMEIQYFKTPSTLSEDLDKEEEYVNLLRKLWAAEKASTTAHAEWKKLGTSAARGWTDKQIRRVKARNTSTFTNLGTLQEQVACFEDDHGIYPRWNPFDPEFLTAQDNIHEAEYRRAVEELHHSVAARLLEMSKLSASGLCYKQRDKITNALKARAGAVRSALDRHNAAAAKIQGREPIVWDDIVKMVSLADLDYLKDTRLDIRTVPWAKPENRNAMELYFGLERAREEINRLNVEIKRLITFMIDDEADFWLAIEEIVTGDTEPTQEQLDFKMHLQREYWRRKALHWRMAERLLLISRLPGFNGDLIPGHRVDRVTFKTALAPLPQWASQVLGISREPLAWESDTPPMYTHSSTVSGRASLEGETLELFNERGIEPEHLVTFMEKVSLE